MNYMSNKGNKCQHPDCSNTARIKGFCQKHYVLSKYYAKPNISRNMKNKGKTCSVLGCNKEAKTKGMCYNHYAYFWYSKKVKKMSCMDCDKLYICKDDTCPNWKERQQIQKEWDADFLAEYNNERWLEQQRR